jgi:hypothetical protein
MASGSSAASGNSFRDGFDIANLRRLLCQNANGFIIEDKILVKIPIGNVLCYQHR